MMPRGKQEFLGSKVILEDFKSAQEKIKKSDFYLTKEEFEALKIYAKEIGKEDIVKRMKWG